MINFKLKYIFAGNPARGTSFTANYLTYCGFLCGHEMLNYIQSEKRWFVGPSGEISVNGGGRLVEQALGESSYIAPQWYDYSPLDKLPVIMIIRNPFKVLQSLIGKALSSGEAIDVDAKIDDILT